MSALKSAATVALHAARFHLMAPGLVVLDLGTDEVVIYPFDGTTGLIFRAPLHPNGHGLCDDVA